MKNLKVILFIGVIAAAAAGLALERYLPGRVSDETAVLVEKVPGVRFSDKKGSPPHYRSDEGLVAFNSFDVVPSIRGYAGPIKVFIVIEPNGRLADIRIIDHRETKNYVHYMIRPEYLNQFVGKSVGDPFEVDLDIDAISRATVSVEALARTVRDSSRIVAAGVLGITAAPVEGRRGAGWKWSVFLMLLSSGLALYYVTRQSKKYLRLRDVVLVISIVTVGIYLSAPFSVIHVYNLLLFRFSSSPLWYVVVFGTLLSVIAAGRFYCGWLCPFGALSEIVGRLSSRKWSVPSDTDDTWRDLKYLFLGVSAFIVFISRRPEYGNFETYVTLFSMSGSSLAWALVVLMLLLNLRIERFWCRYVCPVAALTALLSRRDERYVSCSSCPMGNRPHPPTGECIRCNRCYSPPAGMQGGK